MAKKKKTADKPLRTKLTILEAALGQKEAAKRLGISTSTFRNWKTGKSTPRDREQEKKVNRIYGHNKNKATLGDLKKTVKVERARRKGKEKQIQNRMKNNNPFIISARGFIKKLTKDKGIIEGFLGIGINNVATFDYQRGQLVTHYDIANGLFGKPPRQKQVTVVGTYTNHYIQEENEYLRTPKMPLLEGFSKEWDLAKTLDFLESRFLSTANQVGKRSDNAMRFIGYYL